MKIRVSRRSDVGEQPGLEISKDCTLMTLDLNGYTGMCLMELAGAKHLRERLDQAIKLMEGES